MVMKWISVCLVAMALLGCLSDAQYFKPVQQPQPVPPQKYTPPQPQQPQQPHQPHQPQQPHQPHQPQLPKYEPSQPAYQKYTPPQPQQPHQPKQTQQPYQPKQTQQPYQPKQTQQPKQPPKGGPKPADVFHSCEVEEAHKVQCGPTSISASDCDAINCCFDGRMCYYGKAVTVQCTKDAQFIVVVARDATLPNIDLESIVLLGQGQGCTPVGTTSAFAIYQFPVTACGTVLMEEPGVIIYENRMSSSYEVGVGRLGAITRDTTYELLFQCRYIGTSVEALVIEVNVVPPPLPAAAPGPLRVELRLANGQCTVKGCVEEQVAYNSFYSDSDYPVSKVLREPVYVEVRVLERTDPNLVLTLGRCWATTDANPYKVPQWDLLINGCPYRDDRYLTSLANVDASSGLLYPTHHRRFIFKMFTFVDQQTLSPLKEKVFIHCDTALCQPSAGNSCEPRCYRKRRDIAAAFQNTARPETTVVTSGEVIFTDPRLSS